MVSWVVSFTGCGRMNPMLCLSTFHTTRVAHIQAQNLVKQLKTAVQQMLIFHFQLKTFRFWRATRLNNSFLVHDGLALNRKLADFVSKSLECPTMRNYCGRQASYFALRSSWNRNEWDFALMSDNCNILGLSSFPLVAHEQADPSPCTARYDNTTRTNHMQHCSL